MTSEQWLQVKQTFENARALASEVRDQKVAEISDDEVRRELEELLKAFDRSQEFLERPAVLNAAFESIASFFRGQRLGNYSLVRLIGEGGMGAVYEGQRADGEFEQRVAVKIITRFLSSNRAIERFRTERQILAKLEHPHIARLIDGGTTSDGLPFLVMEFVDGLRIDAYCEQHSLDVTARLQLFRDVCEAVEYAHAQGIIHRDLKPANILVTAAAGPKLLDFGIAKISDSGDSRTETLTQWQAMTPQYASPEQLRGEVTAPASDVYSLGVLLYELLTRRKLYATSEARVHMLSGPDSDSIPPPSEVSGERSWQRSLDLVVKTATQKSPEARYASVRDLIADIDRFLNGVKVQALGRRVPRQPMQSKTVAAIMLAAAALGLLAVYLWRTRTQRFEDRPRSLAVLPFRTLTATSGNEYLAVGLADALITRLSNVRQLAVRPTSSVLKYSGLSDLRTAGRDLKVEAVLEGTIQQAGDRLRISVQLIRVNDDHPLWAESFNESSDGLFAIEDSVSQQVAQTLALRLAVAEREELARHYTENATAYRDYLEGRYSEFRFTQEGLRQAIEYFNQAIARDSKYALAYAGLADAYTTASDWVLPPREALPKAELASRKAIGFDNNLAEAHASLAHALMHEWKLAASGAEFRRALSLSPNNTSIYFAYSEYLSALGREDDAVVALRNALKIDPESAEIMAFIGWPLYVKRDYQSALAAEDRAIQTDPNFWVARMDRAYDLLALHRFPESIEEFRKALALNPQSTISLSGLGAAFAETGQRQQAADILSQLRDMAKRQYVSPMDTGFLEAALGNRDRAIADFRKAYDDGSEMLLFSQVYARYFNIGNDPRFQELVERVKRGW